MIIKDFNFRKDFYDEVKREKHTTIFVNLDVDALCACYMLMHAFNCDHVTYTVNPIDSWSSLQTALIECSSVSKYIILINCGAYRSFMSIDLPENISLFVIESLRPFHLDNVFNGGAIKILADSQDIETWNLPKVDDVYADSEFEESDDEEEMEDEEDGEEVVRKRRRYEERIAQRAIKRQQRAQWKRNRASLLWEYYEKTWHSTPVSVMMLELVQSLNKCDAGMVWCAVVGLSSQLADRLVSLDSYNKVCIDKMRSFIRKYSPKNHQAPGDDVMKISFGSELLLPFYTHWTLYESMTNDVHFSCQSKLWTQKGASLLRHIIATLGITLNEVQQEYSTMPIDRRKEIFRILEKHLNSNFNTFSSHRGYTKQYNAYDFARILSLRLEYRLDVKETLYDRFMASRFILDKFLAGESLHENLNNAIQNYKIALKAIASMVFVSISQSHVISCSNYFLLVVHEVKNTRRLEKPMVIAVPMNEPDIGWFWVTGLMSLAEYVNETDWKSIFARAFEHVAERSNVMIKRDCFDPNIVMVKSEERTKFFNSLDAILEAS